MSTSPWVLGTIAALLGSVAALADDLTTRDVILLHQAGLGAEVLRARVETDGKVFHLSSREILDLHHAGVPESVIVAMIRTGMRGDGSGSGPLPAQAPPGARARLTVSDASGRPVSAHWEKAAHRVAIESASARGGESPQAGAQVDLTLDPGEFEVTVDGVPIGGPLELPAGVGTALILLPPAAESPQARPGLRIERDGRLEYEGPLGGDRSRVGAESAPVAPPVPAFTCPMHPAVRTAAPGSCPECGMELVRVAAPASGANPAGSAGGAGPAGDTAGGPGSTSRTTGSRRTPAPAPAPEAG